MIEIKNLHKYFNKGKPNEIHVINDVTLNLPQKGMVAIFGKSGCGKTTLLNTIGGLDDYASGSLTIEGASVENSDEVRNKYIGYIFQNYNLHAGLTCFENVANALKLCGLNDPSEIEKRVLSALRNVGMEKYKNRTPDTLSGGQQQRIAIARAIVKNPPVILADEPTGNLDEANTLMVMDLLKQIAKDHLVLIVTHEANLVDHYCDTVIELSDGKVVSVRENENAVGLTARDKSAIYLGELNKTELTDENANVEFYGELPREPVKIQIVNQGGRLYLKVNTPKVQIVDEASEVRFEKGVFQAQNEAKEKAETLDMSALPPIEGKGFGKLFTFVSALKSGFHANFQKNKKGKKVLIAVMCLFSAVFVMISCMFGMVFSSIENANDFNQNAFYLKTSFVDDYEEWNGYTSAPSAAIDLVSFSSELDGAINGMPYATQRANIRTSFFESYTGNHSLSGLNGLFLDETACRSLPLVIGKKENLADDEVVITSAVADKFLNGVQENYIDRYENIIGLFVSDITYNFQEPFMRIVGIVDSNEPALYFSPLLYAKLVLSSHQGVQIAKEYGLSVENGSVILATFADDTVDPSEYPAVGESVLIRGKSFTVSSVLKYSEYEDKSIFDSASQYRYFVSDADYIALSKRNGDQHASVWEWYNDSLLLHSYDPQKTEAFLRDKLGNDYDSAVIDAHDILEDNMQYVNEQIVVYSISLAVTLGFLCVAMYFIMRSSLLTRIKEIGVYRAIGVSKKNLLFRFLIEATVLTTLTVFVSYLVVSLGIFACFGVSPLVAEFIYYPVWYALAVLVVLYGVCLVCGVLPIVTLLLKTPSQILAKYDI